MGKKLSEFFASNYLKTEDLPDDGLTLTVQGYTEEDVAGEEKLVLLFKETDKGLICNKTNAVTIAETLGEELDKWKGHQIRLFKTKTDFSGKRVACTRLEVVA